MSYGDMTVAQLRSLAKERGVALGKSMRKAEIAAALEDADAGVQSVAAEVIEERPQGLAVSLLPGTLRADFDALDAKIDRVLADYEGWEPTADAADDLSQVARERKYLNSLARELDERRKDVKREYLRPLNEFEGMVNARRDRIKAVSERLQAVERLADEERRRRKEAGLREHYECVAGLLADVVPYEKIADPKWMNKTPLAEACKRELEDRCRKVASDWETLKGLSLEFADEAELRFFQTLDLGDATSHAARLADDKRRLEEMKAEREEYLRQGAEPAAQPQPAMEPTPAPQPAPAMEPVPADGLRASYEKRLVAALASHEDWHVQKIAEALEEAAAEPRSHPKPSVMVVDLATVEQLRAIGKVCAVFGVTGVFRSGTLAQVCGREMRKRVM